MLRPLTFTPLNFTRPWLRGVKNKVGLSDLEPKPYWGYDDLFHKIASKLTNCFYVIAETEGKKGSEKFKYSKIKMLKGISLNGFLKAMKKGEILVDFDARTGHNHGTKFRMRQNCLPSLFDEVKEF